MSLVSSLKDGVITITLGSKFDFDCVDDFREVYTGAKAQSYIIDFRNTEYMDSSGLGMLLNMKRHIGDAAKPVKLINCRPQVKKVLLISRFETKFDIS